MDAPLLARRAGPERTDNGGACALKGEGCVSTALVDTVIWAGIPVLRSGLT